MVCNGYGKVQYSYSKATNLLYPFPLTRKMLYSFTQDSSVIIQRASVKQTLAIICIYVETFFYDCESSWHESSCNMARLCHQTNHMQEFTLHPIKCLKHCMNTVHTWSCQCHSTAMPITFPAKKISQSEF